MIELASGALSLNQIQPILLPIVTFFPPDFHYANDVRQKACDMLSFATQSNKS